MVGFRIWIIELMTRKLLVLGLIAVQAVLAPGIIRGQSETPPITVEWTTVDPPDSGWTVGDRIPLRLTATYSSSMQVTLPALPEVWGPFEVLDQTPVEPTVNADGSLSQARQATVTLWAPGSYQTPPLTIRYRDADDQLHEVPVPQLSVTVVKVLQEGETEKRDLKPQRSLPTTPLWPWILGAVCVIAVVGVAGWALRTRVRRRSEFATASASLPDPRPPHEIAYSELDRITALHLPAQGEMKHHYTLVADCLRTYVEGRYHIPAMDQTTDELTAALRRSQVDRRHSGLVRELLTEADLVKFAKFHPPIEQAQAAVDQARHIVDVTKVVELAAEAGAPPIMNYESSVT